MEALEGSLAQGRSRTVWGCALWSSDTSLLLLTNFPVWASANPEEAGANRETVTTKCLLWGRSKKTSRALGLRADGEPSPSSVTYGR